ncbi:tetratricopeptide repeat protein [Paraburkholderia sp. BL18I3N2]|uniref:tetratricopeptide repeat protein n=1 Tax=Paraburkholderia sp. BL18I3N2 TaxID=1938799 RepID=UPI002159434D|nr:tetratricopeptide repeat protein [Paraburkholderia sp. BL18I3N2]
MLADPSAYLDDMFDERRLPDAIRQKLPANGSHPLPYARLVIDAEWRDQSNPNKPSPFKDTFVNRRNNGVIAELLTPGVESPGKDWSDFYLSYGVADLLRQNVGSELTPLGTLKDDTAVEVANQPLLEGHSFAFPVPLPSEFGEPVDHIKAFKLAREGAGRGSADAAVAAAAMAWQGQGTTVDKNQAMRWYRFAADRGNVESARWIGNQYLAGTEVPRDESLGLHYLTLATNAGDSASSVSLGGYLTEHHQSLAGKTGVEWLEAAAARRVPAAYGALGYTYARGIAGKQDTGVALNWFSQGAQLGDPASQAWLCSAYSNGNPSMQRRPDYAARWCQAAARSGNVMAMKVLADKGSDIANDTNRVYWQWKVANQGDAKYQSMLGDSYDLGEGVSSDLSAATYWFRRAAEQGNASAQTSLAWHLFTGLGGRVDEYEAFTWASKAAPADVEAQRMVGVAYAYGRGVERDAEAGRVRLGKAMAAGDDWQPAISLRCTKSARSRRVTPHR